MSSTPHRNDPCPCGSGLKYKNCCEGKKKWTQNPVVMGIGVAALLILGLILAGRAFSTLGGGSGAQNCPSGQVWSAEHGHCH